MRRMAWFTVLLYAGTLTVETFWLWHAPHKCSWIPVMAFVQCTVPTWYMGACARSRPDASCLRSSYPKPSYTKGDYPAKRHSGRAGLVLGGGKLLACHSWSLVTRLL